ncbi:response regulator [Streptomyces sp. NPDC007875]|uniref:response regulator n=2 Tax=unclassified Streptomyces TaxID=2593676 RepID=UPI00368E36BA
MTALASPLADAFWATSLRRWNAVCWVLFAAMAVGLVTTAPAGGSKYQAIALLGCVVLCYAVLDRFPGNPVVRPRGYLSVLVLALGGLAYLGSSYAALFMVTLPHYWMFGRTPRASMGFLGLATGATLAGSLVRQGWSAEFFGETLMSTLIVVAVGVLIGLWAHSVVAQSSERARLIEELERTQAQLSEAHQRQGAADERERMARDIHDTLAQGFASIIVLAEAAQAGIHHDPATSAQQLRSAGDGRAALDLVERYDPDVALVDLRMPVLDGVATTAEIVARYPRTRVLILTTYDTDAEIERGVEAGAIGYLLKDTTREQLVDAIHAAARGETVLAPRVAEKLVARMRRPVQEPLTDRETEVLGAVADGLTNAEIGRRLVIAEATVKTHLLRLFAKLDVNDRTRAVVVAMERGLLQRP